MRNVRKSIGVRDSLWERWQTMMKWAEENGRLDKEGIFT